MHKQVDPNGIMLNDHKEVEKEVMRFYIELISTVAQRTKQVDVVSLRYEAQLQGIRRYNLIQLVNDQEIWTGLKGNGDTKAHGNDGYNANFFKKTWNSICGDVNEDIHDFFIKMGYTLQ